MKRFIFLILAAATAVFAACSSDEGTSAYPGKLEVVLTPAWDAVRGMTSSSQIKTVAVALNVESVHWTVTSDSEWCVVDEETSHVGSGEFTVDPMLWGKRRNFCRRSSIPPMPDRNWATP